MADGNSSSSSGIGIFGLMFIVMFAGKIFGVAPVATWSWWWVTAPLWGFPVFLLVVAGGDDIRLVWEGWEVSDKPAPKIVLEKKPTFGVDDS